MLETTNLLANVIGGSWRSHGGDGAHHPLIPLQSLLPGATIASSLLLENP